MDSGPAGILYLNTSEKPGHDATEQMGITLI